MIISLDTETTGVDIAHGAMPFIVTTCSQEDGILFWEWDVDPLTRRPEVPQADVADIVELIDAADLIYLHNAKFDARALATIGVALPWEKVRDTMPASHLLASNQPHTLTWLCVDYLGVDIDHHEINVRDITRVARGIVKKEYPQWRIAKEGAAGLPSVKDSSKRDEDKPWKNDMWLPRALMKAGSTNYIPAHWATAASAYANADSEHTLHLGLHLDRLIRERGYWAIHEHRLQLPRVACEMEVYGVTARGDYTDAMVAQYEEHVAEAAAAMVEIAAECGHDLQLAAGASLNDNMRDFFYGSVHRSCPACKYERRVKHWNGYDAADSENCPKCAARKRRPATVRLQTTKRANLALPVLPSKKTGNASLDADAMKEYLTTLDEGPALDFITLLADKRGYDTALSYMEAYRRFWLPVPGARGYYRIHPSLNPFGTDHLRWASNSPNMQNVSGESKDISNRGCFGPLPTREWWRMDFKSIERRIPPYECGEPKMVEVFERPNEPPYWGSLYYLTASVLYPDEFNKRSMDPGRFKKECPRLYKQAKFFDLAKQYGAGRRKGDMLSKVENSYDLVDSEFPLLAALQDHYLSFAKRNGFVETLPDRSVDPKRGYPVLVSRTEDNRVLSTTPFNYHVSGTACWCKNTALVRCAAQCAAWRAEGFDANIALEVHDELLFDFPRGASMEENRPRAMILKGLMEQAGEDLIPRIPTPVSVEYHVETWAEGVSVA